VTTLSQEKVQLGRFSDVDASDEAAQLVAFIEHAEKQPPIPALRRRSYELVSAGAGKRVVDVGCGAGISVAEMTALGADVTGLDPSAAMIDVARTRFPHCDLLVAGAESLPFPTGSVDGYRAERVYQHLTDPLPALDEARRVLRPGGRLVIVDIDADCWGVNGDDVATTRALLRAFADTITNPWIGRNLRGLLINGGFADVTVESFMCVYTDYADCEHVLKSITTAGVNAGVVTGERADAWLADQRARSQAGRFFVQGPLVVAAGTRT
jgi:ubiquinone/menaquinone biosynthesis C-methylase UbiE